MEVVPRVRKLLHLTSPPLQLSDFQLQLCEEPRCPLFCCRLLLLDHFHQLSLDSLHGTKQGREDRHAFLDVPLWVFLETMNKDKLKSIVAYGVQKSYWASQLPSCPTENIQFISSVTLCQLTLLSSTECLISSTFCSRSWIICWTCASILFIWAWTSQQQESKAKLISPSKNCHSHNYVTVMMMRSSGPHLLLLTLTLHWDGVVTAVVALGAQHTHTPLVAPAIQLQEPTVPFTHPVLQHCDRFNELVSLQGGNSQVRLQVTLTIWGQTHEAGLQGLCLFPDTRITIYAFFHDWHDAILPSYSDLLRHFLGKIVLTKLRTALEGRLTFGTADGNAFTPVWCDAREAEAVTTGDGDGLGENIQTDATLELHIWQENTGGSHDLRITWADYEGEMNHYLHSESKRKYILVTLSITLYKGITTEYLFLVNAGTKSSCVTARNIWTLSLTLNNSQQPGGQSPVAWSWLSFSFTLRNSKLHFKIQILTSMLLSTQSNSSTWVCLWWMTAHPRRRWLQKWLPYITPQPPPPPPSMAWHKTKQKHPWSNSFLFNKKA